MYCQLVPLLLGASAALATPASLSLNVCYPVAAVLSALHADPNATPFCSSWLDINIVSPDLRMILRLVTSTEQQPVPSLHQVQLAW